MLVKISPNEKGNPPGKLADAELHFTEGPFAGLKLIGFAIWERRTGAPAATSRSRPGSLLRQRRDAGALRSCVQPELTSMLRTRSAT